ncbi:chalcone isomerase family protein [Undibacterium umbellatum]|uniref:Chalcone isomerase family protein n=1 Tax=Undibacterium umbellatum TaxID=2762300 RepID=A0ABR6ZB59_9BURK|nr:chalcone isomerase family protein [Undibacterium umbellatum]MBC3908960.1 chalcone isomerase family protein [Undibacterium umbellatum]
MKKSLCILLLSLLGSLALPAAMASELAGITLEDKIRLDNQDLYLNGAGVRSKAIFQVFVAALYLSEKKTQAAEVLALSTAKRMQIIMLRDISAERFGQNFMEGLKHNVSKEQKSKIIDQMIRLGEMFSKVPEFRKGDKLTVDWLPDTGTVIMINGKKTMDSLPDPLFYNALLKLWLGENTAQDSLKRQLLGEQSDFKKSLK